jgi:hypothetical protein
MPHTRPPSWCFWTAITATKDSVSPVPNMCRVRVYAEAAVIDVFSGWVMCAGSGPRRLERKVQLYMEDWRRGGDLRDSLVFLGVVMMGVLCVRWKHARQ